MNFEELVKSDMFLTYLASIVVSYIIVTYFNKSRTNNFEKPYDYYKYYIVDTSKNYLKIFLLSPIIFILINYLKKNSKTPLYNFKIIEELYLMIVKIAKGYTRIK